MRLGGPVEAQNPEEWADELLNLGYTAGLIPKSVGIDDTILQNGYIKIAKERNLVIAEVGAWSNPISTDEKERQEAIRYCQERLEIAERVGAKCCVNIAGSKSSKWDGPHPDNMTDDTFALIVDTTREIIDAVKPANTYFTLEPMPWIFPYDPDSYLRLINAIDRNEFGVHFDPVNMITSIEKFYSNSKFLIECFQKLGPHIKSIHAKDILIEDSLTLHLLETRPGKGFLDFDTFLKEVAKLPKDMPFLLEHLPSMEEYKLAAEHIRKVAKENGIKL